MTVGRRLNLAAAQLIKVVKMNVQLKNIEHALFLLSVERFK
jgi:hypothetical protein